MSSRLTVSETIELLARLKETLRHCAARNDQLDAQFQAGISSSERRFNEQIETRRQALARSLTDLEAECHASSARLTAIHEKRNARISKAHKAAQRKVAKWITEEEGRRRYPLQRDVLETQRGQAEAHRKNDSALAAITAQLAAERQKMDTLAGHAYKLFRGCSLFRRWLEPNSAGESASSVDPNQLLERLRQRLATAEASLVRYRRLSLPKVFRSFALGWWIVLLVIVCGAVLPLTAFLSLPPLPLRQLAAVGAGVLSFILFLHFLAKQRARPLAAEITEALQEGRELAAACLSTAQKRHGEERERIDTAANSRLRSLEVDWRTVDEEAADWRESLPRKIDEKSWRLSVKMDQLHRDKLDGLERDYRAKTAALKREFETWERDFSSTRTLRTDEMRSTYEAGKQEVERTLNTEAVALRNQLAAARVAAESDFPHWSAFAVDEWVPPSKFETAARFAQLDTDVAGVMPLVLRAPREASIVFESFSSATDAVSALNALILRLLAASPAGKVNFTLIDPLKLGQNFASVMHLADYGENLINGRIWTEPAHIEERLAELNVHMEKVIQSYLRNEYADIAQYNAQAGAIAEKYHFLVVADFPTNFTEPALRRLLRIAATGARCGVFALIHWDRRSTSPHDALLDELRQNAVCVGNSTGQWTLLRPAFPGVKVLLDAMPNPEFTTAFLHRVGAASRGSTRVEVPFSSIAPANGELWTSNTSAEIRVAIGRSGATKTQCLALGKGTRQHALIAGKTGSGKSTLFHGIITNLSLWCSPHEIEFYLVDFKKGVEFKCYAAHRLPHARVIAIESDREFGLSVLERVDEELKRRGELFRQAGVLDLSGFRQANPNARMPRCLVIIDEFQEFFVEDDRISQTANVLLDRIVRQGRAFGIHVLLGSQTLGGAYTLARTTLGQMVVRIALQCNEADAYLIMDESNAAPRFLSRPGEGIYNDMAGAVEANSPFQAVWLPDDERDLWLKRVRKLADTKNFRGDEPMVFEGNAPADIRDNLPLLALLDSSAVLEEAAPRLWLGAPNAIKGPTEAVFHRRSGSNLLIVGQREDAVATMLAIAQLILPAQFPKAQCHVLRPGAADVDELLVTFAAHLEKRIAESKPTPPPLFLLIDGLQHFRKLRLEDDFAFGSQAPAPAAQLRTLIAEGPPHGIHVIIAVDNYNNALRYLGRKSLGEFDMRVLFQMSANDSASLCDDPKASTLGLHRALFYHEREGWLETFRPYADPGSHWFAEAARKLASLHRIQPGLDRAVG